MAYSRGQVVWISAPFDSPNERGEIMKRRPAVVVSMNEGGTYTLCLITTKNRTGQQNGFWVKADSEDGRKMGIPKDSFVQAKTVTIPNELIGPPYRPIGHCPFINHLEALIGLK